MTTATQFTIRRILVPLSSSGQSLPGLEMAARLAAGFHAELVGVYLREPDFLAAAALPVCRISYAVRSERQILNVANMERALRVRAAQQRAALEATARRMNLRWSFQDITGSIDEMIEKAVHDFDLVALNHPGAISPQGFSSFFARPRGLKKNAPVVALVDGGMSALAAAAALARLFAGALHVLLSPSPGKEEKQQLGEVKAWLSGHHQPADIIQPQQGGNDILFAALLDLAPSLLVMGRRNSLRGDDRFKALISRLDCPLFLVAG